MILNAFTVYDCKAEAYLPPFFTLTPALAIRSFQTAANQEGHDFNKYAADYTLFQIGYFDDSNAELHRLEALSNLGTALSYIIYESEARAADVLQLSRTSKEA